MKRCFAVLGFAIFLWCAPAHAYLSGNGNSGCGSCGGIIQSLPMEQQKGAQELQTQFELKSENELDILIALNVRICGVVDCKGVDAETVSKLAELVKDAQRNTLTQSRLDTQLWIALGAMIISILSLAVSFFNFRKPK